MRAVPEHGKFGDRPIQVECFGLEDYDIQGAHDVDWAYGRIRSREGVVVAGFSFGPMVADLVPRARPAGFRSFRVEHIGTVTMRYGHNVRENEFQVTLHGAPLDIRINIVSMPKDADTVLRIARILSATPCEWRWTDTAPSNSTLQPSASRATALAQGRKRRGTGRARQAYR